MLTAEFNGWLLKPILNAQVVEDVAFKLSHMRLTARLHAIF